MAITFPRPLPTLRWRSVRLELDRVDFLSPEAGGRTGAVSAGVPLWSLSLEPTFRTEADSEALRAWVSSLRGAQRLFLGRDPTSPNILSRPKALGFSGDASSWSVNTARDVLTLNGFPAGLVLRPGDMVGLRWTTDGADRRALVRWLETATASGGGSVSGAVEPALPALVPGGAVAHIGQAACLMRLRPATQVGAKGAGRTVEAAIEAIQDLLP